MKETKHYYEVIVGNIGMVYGGSSKMESEIHFDHYKTLSVDGVGRASGESISLWTDSEPILEHEGTNEDSN